MARKIKSKNSQEIYKIIWELSNEVHTTCRIYNQSLSALSTAFSITDAPSVQCSGVEYSGSQCDSPSFDCTNIMVVGSIYAANCASCPAPE